MRRLVRADAQGRSMLDYLEQGEAYEIIERDDGYLEFTSGPEVYFREFREWNPLQKEAIMNVSGKVLDLGCGAGRHALYLQERGFSVLGVDSSDLAVEVCRRRGVREVHALPVTKVTRSLGIFDTILMLGNNLGLLANRRRGRWLLKRFATFTTPTARIIAESLDPHRTRNPLHLAYHQANLQRNRLPGQVRLRVRYLNLVGPWFDYLFLSPEELRVLTSGTGWRVDKVLQREGPGYIAVLVREIRRRSPRTGYLFRELEEVEELIQKDISK